MLVTQLHEVDAKSGVMIPAESHEDGFQQSKSTSTCSQRRSSSSLLTRAFNYCRITDSQEERCSQPPPAAVTNTDKNMLAAYRSMSLEMCTQPSQDYLCTPDFTTPVDQQFHAEYDPNTDVKELSPKRITKRPRQLADAEELSSQLSLSSRSVGEPSTSSRNPAGCNATLPPVPRGHVKTGRQRSPQSFKNPFLTRGYDRDQLYQFSHKVLKPSPCVSRVSIEFQLGKEVGSGNFSKVYKATHRLDGCVYAIKKSRNTVCRDEDRNMWLQEVQALAAAGTHENIVRYFSAWAEQDGAGEQLYIQLELCDETLSHRILAGVKFKETEIVEIMKQIASALAHLHKRAIVHLDVKPDNIYYSQQSSCWKLGDFGLATLGNGQGTVVEGDTRYCSKELLNSDYSCLDKADIFALGATLYELASGTALPAGGQLYERLRAGKLTMLPHISTKLYSLLKAMMHVDPKQRPSADSIVKGVVATTKGLPLTPVQINQ